mgnify:FL=1
MRDILKYVEQEYIEYLPEDFIREFELPNIVETIKSLHYPKNAEDLKKAKYRLYFDRLLKVQLQSRINKQQYLSDKKPVTIQKEEIDRELIKTFVSRLPFQLTDAQKKVIKQMIEDFSEESAILRLLQ